MQYITQDKGKTITLSDEAVSELTVDFMSVLESCALCGKEIIDGCILTIGYGYERKSISVCNGCLFDLYFEMLKISKKRASGEYCYSITLGETEITISFKALCTFTEKIRQYFCKLYKTHTRDNLFASANKLKGEFAEQIICDNEENKLGIPAKKGARKMFFNNKDIKADLTCSFEKNIQITNASDAKYKGLFDLTALNDIPCSFCDGEEKAIYALTDKRGNGFTFAFCANHFQSFTHLFSRFYETTNPFCYSVSNMEYKEYKNTNEECYLFGKTEDKLYRVSLDGCSVFLSEAGMKAVADKVLSSQTYKELFPIEFAKFSYIHSEDYMPEADIEKELLERDVNKLKREIVRLNDKLKAAEKTIRKKSEDQISYYSNRILNCRTPKTVITLGRSAKIAQANPFKSFKVTYLKGVECKTVDHFMPEDTIALFETDGKDKFCFSMCAECMRILIKDIKASMDETSYYDDIHNITIKNTPENSRQYCYCCGGGSDNDLKTIMLNRVQFSLCKDDMQLLISQLEEAIQEIKKMKAEKTA